MSKDSKAALKEAKSLFKAGKYNDAIKKCYKILKNDKNNYSALLLIAGSMKGIEEYKSQVHLPLKKAIKIQPDNPLAYQGLVTYYEKEPDNKDTWIELIPIYCKLIQIDKMSPKWTHYITEMSRLVMNLKDSTYTIQAIDALSSIRKECDEQQYKIIDEPLVNILTEFPDLSQQYSDIFQLVLAALVEDKGCNRRYDYFTSYLQLLFSLKKYDGLVNIAAKMHRLYPQDLRPLEWICYIYSEQKVLTDVNFCKGMQIDYFYNHLLQLNPASYMGIIAKAMHLWQENNIIDARDVINEAAAINPQEYCAWTVLSQINKTLYCWLDAEIAAREALKYMKDHSHLYRKIRLILIESILMNNSRKNYQEAIDMCKEFLADESNKEQANDAKLLLARGKILQNDVEAIPLLNKLASDLPEKSNEIILLRVLQLKMKNCLEEAIDVIGSALKTSDSWFILGQMNWQLCNYNHGLMAFLKGLQADSNNWQCLVYLGHYYREQGCDLDKSKKCYQKALRINPNSDEAGPGLSTVYRLLQNNEENITMLQEVTSCGGGGPKWAWLQLGLQQLSEDNINEAIKSLRYVIKADPNDNHCWELLADAYWARGAHTSALKSYQRALGLCPGSLYPMIQIANINLVLGRLLEAKNAFLQVLTHQSRYIPALKGVAEACLNIAKENSKNQLLTRALNNIQQAVDHITEAIIENSNLSCLWKLLGDACYRVALFPPNYCTLIVAEGLVKDTTNKTMKIKIGQSELFSMSSRCYCRALSISTDSSFLWHDLASSYLAQYHVDSTVDKPTTADKSLSAAKQAVQLNPTSWFHWNLLGVICMTEDIKNYALAQHSWIMAIDNEPNNAIAWTNLGTLYLYIVDSFKANDAFSRAQRADPEYPNSWIGQAMIAESIKSKETMDLFRHATQLGYHPEAATGYAHWVISTILDPDAANDPLYAYTIVKMHAVPVAIDVMTWYVDREPTSIYGKNTLGLLLEREKLVKSAAIQFSEALALALPLDNVNQRDIIRINYSRVLMEMERYGEAIEVCQEVEMICFKSHCQLALTLFKAKRFEDSYKVYEHALQWLANAGSDEAHILCAMAAMAYKFRGADQTKTLLYQCIELQPATVAGLLAAAALGLRHDDYNLTSLVLKESMAYQDEPNYRHHIAILTAYSRLMYEDLTGAVRIICKAVHRHPDDVPTWVGLVRVLLETSYCHFGNCAQKALFLGRNTSITAVAQVACLSCLGEYVDSRGKKGLRSIEKTLFSFPSYVESWANLVVVLLPRCEKNPDDRLNATWLARLISIIYTKFPCSPPMYQWLMNNYKRLSKSSRSSVNK